MKPQPRPTGNKAPMPQATLPSHSLSEVTKRMMEVCRKSENLADKHNELRQRFNDVCAENDRLLAALSDAECELRANSAQITKLQKQCAEKDARVLDLENAVQNSVGVEEKRAATPEDVRLAIEQMCATEVLLETAAEADQHSVEFLEDDGDEGENEGGNDEEIGSLGEYEIPDDELPYADGPLSPPNVSAAMLHLDALPKYAYPDEGVDENAPATETKNADDGKGGVEGEGVDEESDDDDKDIRIPRAKASTSRASASRSELMAEARKKGLSFSNKVTKADLIRLLQE